jgi:hypothetical protein
MTGNMINTRLLRAAKSVAQRDPLLAALLREATTEIDRLRQLVAEADPRGDALRAAREKLVLYRQTHSGEYVGGTELTALLRQIDQALER